METSTIWLSPKDFSNKDSSVPLLIETPSVSYPSTVVTCKKDPGEMKWAIMNLDLPQNVIIREITVCYQLTSENSFISQIRLIEMRKPDHATIRHDDATDLRSTSHVCYSTKINGLVTTIETKMTLELGLNFLNKDDKIMLGAVGIKILFPERSCVNVRDFGALGGPDSRDASSIQNALDAVPINGGGTVCIPAGTYHLEKTISIGDNVSLQGAGLDSTIICDHTEPGANFLLVSVQPVPPSSRVKNVRISGITFQNGRAREAGATKGKDAIRAEKTDDLLIEDCKFTEIEGFIAVAVKYARNVTVQRCQFYHWTHTGLFVGVESENIHVLDNVFDTVVFKPPKTEPYIKPYTLAVGYEKAGEGSFYVKNLWVRHNIFLNNPSWSGVTCHGGENIWIQYNYFANVRLGIDVSLVNRRPKNGERILDAASIPVLRNVHIANNIVIQGKGWYDHYGILFTSQFGSLVFGELQNLWAEDADITGNKISGFGGSVNVGAITVRGAKNVNILNNDIDSYATGAVTLVDNVHGCKVFQNSIHDSRGDSHSDEAAIQLRNWGLYGISIIDNTVEPSSLTKAPLAFLRAPKSPPMSGISVQIANNTEIHRGKYRFIYATYLPVQRSSSSPPATDLTQKNGDIIFTDKDKPGWRVSFPEVGYGSFITDVIVKVTIGADNKASIVSDYFTTDGTLKGNYQWLPEGMNVTIKGAGPAGGPLDTRILKNDGRTLTLDRPAEASVLGKVLELKYQGLTIVPL